MLDQAIKDSMKGESEEVPEVKPEPVEVKDQNKMLDDLLNDLIKDDEYWINLLNIILKMSKRSNNYEFVKHVPDFIAKMGLNTDKLDEHKK